MLEDAEQLLPLIEARYREGERIHRREWLRWTLRRFRPEATQELADEITYLAMRRAMIRLLEATGLPVDERD